MTTHVHGLIGSRPSHRNVKLIWAVFAVAALAVLTTVIVLMSTASHHAAQSTPSFLPSAGNPGTSNGQAAIECWPSKVIHPC
jgi:hypothetical protein